MKTLPAITAQSLAQAAGRKTRRVQKKLHDAESEMHAANEELARTGGNTLKAVERNAAAEQKVHEAVEELEVVKQMLDHESQTPARESAGASGDGVKSLLPHLKRRA